MFSLVFAFVFIGAGPESLPLDDRDEGAEIKPESLYPVNANFIQRSLWPIKECLRMRTSEELLSLRIVIGGLIVGGTVALMHYCELKVLDMLVLATGSLMRNDF
jgi:hypothetical protein